MQTGPTDGLRRLKIALIGVFAMAGIAMAVVWANYLCAALAGFDLLERQHVSDPARVTTDLWLAAVLTVVALAITWISSQRKIDLMRRGVWTHANVEKISSIGKGGTRPVTFAYEVQNVQYRKKRDVPKVAHSQYDASTRVWLIYDPKKPARSEVFVAPVKSGGQVLS